MVMSENPKILCFRITEYDDLAFCPLFFLKDHYFFRGQADAKWGLQTSLERKYQAYKEESSETEIKEHNIPADKEQYFSNAFSKALEYKEEHAAIQTFYRLSSLTENLSDIEILARMQHYGAATRLLDVTTSFFIALFFALEGYGNQDRAVWIFNRSYFYKHSNLIRNAVHFDLEEEKREAFTKLMSDKDKIYTSSIEEANKYIGNPPAGKGNSISIIPLEITGNNPRLIAQNGAFLFPTNIKKSFKKHLCSILKISENDFFDACNNVSEEKFSDESSREKLNDAVVIKLIIPAGIRHLADRLLNAANISYRSIYPDEIGIAKSIKYW